MNDLYETNDDFKEYVDKYCTKHRISPEVAFTHELLKGIAMMYQAQAEIKRLGGNKRYIETPRTYKKQEEN